jgi:hypothetical protein
VDDLPKRGGSLTRASRHGSFAPAMNSNAPADLRSEFVSIRDEGIAIFGEITESLGPIQFAYAWNKLSPEQRKRAIQIRKRLTDLSPQLLDAARHSPLLEDTDGVEIRRALRRMSSSLLMKEFEYVDAHIIADEDRVLGMSPAKQQESDVSAQEAQDEFKTAAQLILREIDLFVPLTDGLRRSPAVEQTSDVRRYRPNTAFIMMQIDRNNPHLEDINNAIKETFRDFDIEARRADEIEHSDAITQRILDEITTSEYLIADLTGERPSVYYEIGYAHAIGKHPILYRQEGAKLHFDLYVHNVPEYKNITHLKELLQRRLIELTNTNPYRDSRQEDGR